VGCVRLYLSTVTPAPQPSGDGCVRWLHPEARVASALGARPRFESPPPSCGRQCQDHDARSRVSGSLDTRTVRSLLGYLLFMHCLNSWKNVLAMLRHMVNIGANCDSFSMQGRIAGARRTRVGATSTVGRHRVLVPWTRWAAVSEREEIPWQQKTKSGKRPTDSTRR
jgi:hypothetical protein